MLRVRVMTCSLHSHPLLLQLPRPSHALLLRLQQLLLAWTTKKIR
jgi:hypothetical protein